MMDAPPAELLSTIEIEPPAPADAAVIWLHGLGAAGRDFEPIVPELGLPPDHTVRFVFPNAPRIPVTINAGLIMPAWYDIASLDAAGQDGRGIRRSAGQLERLIAREIERGIGPDRIVLAGFSQGGVVALFTALRYPKRLAGVLALSTYVGLAEELPEELAAENAALPVFQAHGTYDPMIPLAVGQTSRDWLVEHGYRTEWHEYPMAHQVCLEEIHAVGAWLRRVLPPAGSAGEAPQPAE